MNQNKNIQFCSNSQIFTSDSMGLTNRRKPQLGRCFFKEGCDVNFTSLRNTFFLRILQTVGKKRNTSEDVTLKYVIGSIVVVGTR